ncbi:uncharacterized protein A1O9_12951 [Exophiala aquamarina CBS 119918]|uniref:PRISE-like Rossmann-fold domain-containing protein n=1 Tax=Exophiala aquamarina CBS 119918 TaxID=1182545 RepID=A0A072NUE7_9EURO|nr:uncharacterized protein A1O9_12951 [Exophiala aquamarina CBS 119918]KEF50997.1 hypothetical protein A1O9_12951 [Exophiala aquamarina CBS 119918]
MLKHALVLGASGIQGWAIVRELLDDRNQHTFSKVTAVTNRPLVQKFLLWPQSDRLQLVHGLELNGTSKASLEKNFREKILDIDAITHVYYCAYRWLPDQVAERTVNTQMLQNAISVIASLSCRLEFVVLLTGAKVYGMHLMKTGFPFGNYLPLSEDLPPLPEPHGSQLLYTAQTKVLRDLSLEKEWTWCEIRADLVIGFVPNNNPHCLPQILGIYLALYKYIEGEGSTVAFPGSKGAYHAKFVPASQDTIAKLSTYASLHPDTMGHGAAYNVGDKQEPTSWSRIWPTICSVFGLQGFGPLNCTIQPIAYIQAHREQWDQVVRENDLRAGFVDNDLLNPSIFIFMTGLMDFDRQLSIKKSRQAGFVEERSEEEAWFSVFQRFVDAKIIPPVLTHPLE